MSRCVIVGGAAISNPDFVKSYLSQNVFYIFCDSGLDHAEMLGRKPDLIIGDFDSHAKPDEAGTETIVLPCVKDDTDTVFAAKEAIRRGFDEVLLIGAAGGRFDHTIGNVSILLMLHKAGIRGMLVDDYSDMEIVADTAVEIDESCSFFSVLSVFGNAEGVYIKGAKYPLENAAIDSDYQYGISNEVLKGTESAPGKAQLSVRHGQLLLVRVYNEQDAPFTAVI